MLTYSPLIERAIRTAMRLHEGDTRKTDPNLPYMTHLIHVAFILQGHGFGDDVVAAGLLHDTLEDTEYTVEDATADFGDEIAAMVLAVTEEKHWRWEQRKERYLRVIESASPEVKAICAADKIHNLSSIIDAYIESGDAIWKKFSRGRERTLAFYERALESVSAGWEHPIIDAYRLVIARARLVFQ